MWIACSASDAKAAVPLSKLRLSATGKCRPKRLSASARSAALWTRGHASPASCRGAGRLRERSAGSRQKLPSSSNAGEAAACSGGTTSALARPFTHGLPAAARARLVFHAIGTRDAALNAGRSEQALRANSEFSGRTPDWC